MKKTLFTLFVLLNFFTLCLGQTKIKVACVGNSITEGPGRQHPESYPLLMQNILGEEYEVINFGVSGRTLLKKGDRPYWDEPQYDQVLDYEPDIVVIKLGTNDTKPQNWKHKEEFVENYIDMIRSFDSAMPEKGEIYVCIPVPVFESRWGINAPVLEKEMIPMLKKIIKSTRANKINLYRPLKKHADLFPDGIHPNSEGNQIMAEVIAKKID
ncbi:GDSL-type esterase/lipase family protein [Echinicola jeungdonensis]|uniref:GDSL-type esterase/lipase family protein n=1 Tax=Echinicola jeungdonensis TaxID=709343 RepID=A0ABV5J4K8_9BACT|nr:GDSL-type esterase/lipase family protein [Echinicola jeungdonensis]MDN3668744.1 GDSL-type esterase/lipase family protein [Echinicola jeungdonensis]